MNPLGKSLVSTVSAACAAALLFAGCGGGGSPSSTVPVAQPTDTPASSPQYPSANLVLSFPYAGGTASSARTPQYVSPNSTKVEVIVNTIGGVAPVGGFLYADVTTNLVFSGGGQNCTVSGGTATCTISVVAPPGNVNYTFNTKDGSNNILSTVTTTIANTKGINNIPNITLKGVVKTVNLSATALSANTSVAAPGEALTVTPLDASGATIVNGATAANFNNPITLTDNDPTGQTKLTLNGAGGASSVVVSSPSDVVKLTYTGQAVNGFTITASGTGITGTGSISTTVNDVTFTGTTLDDAAHGGLNTDANWGQDTLFFLQPSGTQNVSGAELGWTNAPFSQQFDLDPGTGTGGTCGSGGGIATFSASPATTFTVTAHGSGVCSVRLKEHGTGYPLTGHTANVAGSPTHDGTFWISVTTSDVTVNGKQRRN